MLISSAGIHIAVEQNFGPRRTLRMAPWIIVHGQRGRIGSQIEPGLANGVFYKVVEALWLLTTEVATELAACNKNKRAMVCKTGRNHSSHPLRDFLLLTAVWSLTSGQ